MYRRIDVEKILGKRATQDIATERKRQLRPHAFGNCTYCGRDVYPPSDKRAMHDRHGIASRDHIHPACLGGKITTLSCVGCNSVKGATPEPVFRAFLRGMETVKWTQTLRDQYRQFQYDLLLVGLHSIEESEKAFTDEEPAA